MADTSTHEALLNQGIKQLRSSRSKIELQEKLASNIETLATQRILKIVKESKQRCEPSYEFKELKMLHSETLSKFTLG